MMIDTLTNLSTLNTASVEQAFANAGYGVKFVTVLFSHKAGNNYVYLVVYRDEGRLDTGWAFVWEENGRIVAEF